jgi:hypothetical protein
MLGIAESSGENRIEDVLDGVLHCPLLAEEHISNAKNFLFSISYGSELPLLMNEFENLTKKFEELTSKNALVIWGRSEDPSLGDKIKLSVIISKYANNHIENETIVPIDVLSEGEKQKGAILVDGGSAAFSGSAPQNMKSELDEVAKTLTKEEHDFGFLNQIGDSFDTKKNYIAAPVHVPESDFSVFNPGPEKIRTIRVPEYDDDDQFKFLIDTPRIQQLRQENQEDFQDKALLDNRASSFMMEEDIHDFFKNLPD